MINTSQKQHVRALWGKALRHAALSVLSAGPLVGPAGAACCAGAVYSLLLEESWDDLTGLTSGLSEEKLGFLCPAACRKTMLQNWLIIRCAPRGRSSSVVLGVIKKSEGFFCWWWYFVCAFFFF